MRGYGPEWGPLYGWWIMPLLGLLFMAVFFFVTVRVFGSKGVFCGMKPTGHSEKNDSLKELKYEIRPLRVEIKEPRNKDNRGDEQ